MSGGASKSYVVEPVTQVGGSLAVPGDKSISHRALMFGGIATGSTRISGFLDSADCRATLEALRALGVKIERPGSGEILVSGAGAGGLRASRTALDMGNAGTAMRLFMGLLAGQPFDSTLIGDESLMRRPMERVAKPLRLMGARLDTEQGHPPVLIHGGSALQGIDYVLPMASAQVKSAVLLAGLHATGITRVTEPAPTRDHTERMLQSFGVGLERSGAEGGGATVSLRGGQSLRGTTVTVPGDISSAAFFIVAGCLAAKSGLTLRSVGVNPTRTGLIDMLRLMGADIEVKPMSSVGSEPMADITVRAAPLKGVVLPEQLVPLAIDELPVFFIAAACAQGETLVTGAGELRVKESDRLAAMASGLSATGVQCELLNDGIRIQGGGLRGGRVHSHGDHRIAMAFAVASTRATSAIEIDDVANVGTSFPDFPAAARAIGLRLTERGG
jgi:3-phosphoshikimate 1-carboxyvinyltransferase